MRNKALILIGFWRAFRSSELCGLKVENIQVISGRGLEVFISSSKGDRKTLGEKYFIPALEKLCPMQAYVDWIKASKLVIGAAFPGINRWGAISKQSMHPNSLISLMRKLFKGAGILNADLYSSHSLRRGFAFWASDNNWDLPSLMEYVGWKDAKTAMTYLKNDKLPRLIERS